MAAAGLALGRAGTGGGLGSLDGVQGFGHHREGGGFGGEGGNPGDRFGGVAGGCQLRFQGGGAGFDAAGRGLFFGRDEVDGRAVLVRFVITPEGRDRIRFVQSFSADAGATWQDNWIAVDTRLPDRP